MINTVRSTFPVGTAIIWANECGSTYPPSGGGGRRRRRKASNADNTTDVGQLMVNGTDLGNSVPGALDWISVDHYRGDTKPGFIGQIRKDVYEAVIYPKLQAHQKVAIIPQVGHPKDNFKICSDSCTAGVELQDAKDAGKFCNNP